MKGRTCNFPTIRNHKRVRNSGVRSASPIRGKHQDPDHDPNRTKEHENAEVERWGF
jgi:hypothetical protein